MIKNGIAFVCEGQTEEVFYKNFINYYCMRNECLEVYKIESDDIGEQYIYIKSKTQETIIKFHCASTLSQMTNCQHWIDKKCINEVQSIPWVVYLCYDTDSYKNDITQFYEGDWKDLRENIQKLSDSITIVDLAVKAEIEDIILIDKEGIAKYLNVASISVPNSGQGKGKLKAIFRKHERVYHEGYRAEGLIKELNFDIICENSLINLSHVKEQIISIN